MSIKYGGQVIHQCRDSHGPIEVVEFQQKLRSLHFGNKTQQATMFLYNPVLLVHKYTQAMLTPLCWQQPRKVLILGLGGGSLAKHLLYHFEGVSIDAVELRPQVTQIAHDLFGLPKPDRNLQIHHGAAQDYLRDADFSESYDLILVDLFLTSRGRDVSIGIERQLDKLAQMLTADGSITINIIGASHFHYPGMDELRCVFDDRLYMMSVDSSNIVLLARHEDIPDAEAIDFATEERKLNLPFRQYYNKLMPVWQYGR